MKTASVSELKAKLSAYLDAVKAGQEIVVTDRGLPVARISGIPVAEQVESRMARLAAAGMIRPGSDKIPESFWHADRPDDPDGLSLQFVLEERSIGR